MQNQHGRGRKREAPGHDRSPCVPRMNEHVERGQNEHDDVADRVRPRRRLSADQPIAEKIDQSENCGEIKPTITPTVTSHAEKFAHIISADHQ